MIARHLSFAAETNGRNSMIRTSNRRTYGNVIEMCDDSARECDIGKSHQGHGGSPARRPRSQLTAASLEEHSNALQTGNNAAYVFHSEVESNASSARWVRADQLATYL